MIYVEDAIIQATSGSANKHNGHGVMVTDARTGVVYFEYKEKEEYKPEIGTTTLDRFAYLPLVNYQHIGE